MAKLNLSQAAKAVGKNRTTIWRHINTGKLSSERNNDGNPVVDTSELLRVYGEIINFATDTEERKQHQATPSYEELVSKIKELIKEQKEMRDELTNLTHRITLETIGTEQEEKSKPEDDPKWPKQINNIEDIVLRRQIRDKYNL